MSEQLDRIEEKLDRLLALHAEPEPLACPKCGSTERLVEVRTNMTLPSERPMLCNACGANFDAAA
jgi:NAD-dependent SIR2 family protein deacetylase